MPHTCSRQGNKSGAFYGNQNYGENHYNTFTTNDSVHAEIHACKKVAWRHRDKNNKTNKQAYNLLLLFAHPSLDLILVCQDYAKDVY